MKNAVTLLFFFISLMGNSQTNDSFDIASFAVPEAWKKEVKTSVVSYTKTSNAKGGYCVIAV